MRSASMAVGADGQTGRVHLGAGAGHAQLDGLEVAHAHRGVVGAALLDRLDGELERGLRVADAGAGQTVGAERGQGHAEQGLGLLRAPGNSLPPRMSYMHSARCSGTKTSLARDRLGSGAPHAEHLPVVDDLVFAAWHQAHPVIDDPIAVAHGDRQHVPGGGIDAAREVPEAADHEAAVHAPALPLGEGDAGGDQRVGILAPDLLPAPARRRAPASSDGWRGCRRSSRWTRSHARSRPGRRTSPRTAAPCRPSAWADGSGRGRRGGGRPACPSPSARRLPPHRPARAVSARARAARRIASS